MKSSLPTAAVLLVAFILILPAVSSALSPSKVTLNFMCPCGSCDEALSTCECPQSDGFRSQIAGMVGRGYNEDQVIQDFRGRFGPDVLIANAALAPNSGGLLSKASNKKTFGIILLIASFSLVAFSLGKYISAPTPVPARRKSKQRPQASSKASKRTEKRESRPQEGFRDGIDDDLLDD